MISNQIMQNTIEGIKAIARVELFVADIDGKLVASTKSTGNSFESLRQTARRYRGVSSLRSMMTSSWNTF